MAEPTIYVDPPVRRQRKGGILAVTEGPVRLERLLGASVGVEYQSAGCGLPSATRNGCYDDGDQEPKDQLEGISVEDGITPAFAQYAGVDCWLEDDTTEFEQRAEKLLAEGRDRRLEAELWAWASDSASTGTAATVIDAIADAEQAADGTYVGEPVIVMSRRLLTIAAEEAGAKWDKDAGYHRTASGTPIIASGAIAETDALSIIGWPTVYDSPVRTTGAQAHRQNKQKAIAEQAFAIAVDCLYRHTVTITA